MDQAAPRPRRSGWLRPLLPLGLGAVGLTLLGWALWPRPTPQTVQAETTLQIDGIGEIESLTQQALIAPAESVVVRVLPAGVDVDAGALLVELRSEPLRLQIDQERQLQQAETTQARIAQLDVDSRLLQLRADAAAVRQRLESQTRRLRLIEPLVTAGALSRFEFESEQLAADDLRGQLAALTEQIDLTTARLAMLRKADDEAAAAGAQRRAGLEQQWQALSVRAPFPGRWAEASVEVGTRVASGAVLGRLIDDRRIVFAMQVPERHLHALSEGQAVDLAIAGQHGTGRVSRIDRTLSGGLFRVDVALDSGSGWVDGQTGSYRFSLPLSEPRYWVSAELGVEAHTQAEVWVERDGVRERRTVQFGARQGDRLTVQAGAVAGDRLSLAD